MTPRTLSPQEHTTCQALLLRLAGELQRLPLEAFLAGLERAEAAGPVLDPSLYLLGAPQLEQIARLARTLYGAQMACAGPVAALRAWALDLAAPVYRAAEGADR